jgi:mannose-1-phosphate guanylyltransferase
VPQFSAVSVPAIVLAGGLGTRLREITGDRYPKPMVPVPLAGASHPFLEFVLAQLRAQGIVDIIICIGHLGESIQRYFGDGSRFGLQIDYDDAGLALTATRVMRAADRLSANEYLVVCGDTYHPFDLPAFMENFQRRPRWLVQLAVLEQGPGGPANVALDADGTVTVYDANGAEGLRVGLETGTLTMRKEALAGFDAALDLSLTDDVYPELIRRQAVGAWASRAPFFDIGTPRGYRDFCRFAAQDGATPLQAMPA